MGLKFWAAGLCAAVVGVMAFAGSPADAAQKKKGVTATDRQVVFASRSRTRITVQRRSFLDGGKYILPGDYKYMDYATPPAYSPANLGGAFDNTAFYRRSPLPGPFELPSRQNPWPWNWCVGC